MCRVFTLGLLVLPLLWLSGCHQDHPLMIESLGATLPADGRLHRAAILRLQFGRLYASNIAIPAVPTVSPVLPEPASLEQDGDSVALLIRSPVLPERTKLRLVFRDVPHTVAESFVEDDQPDARQAGLPEWMPLHSAVDRAAFRRWFTAMAESAADMPPSQLPKEISDCSALLRHCFRESLRAHDDRWYAQFAAQQMPSVPSVAQWSYPNTPLGLGLFRVRPGTFAASDSRDGAFSQFADAKTLIALNTFFVSRDLSRARPGDLIFFRLLEGGSQYHSMIVTGAQAQWVVYHTGPIDGGKGEMRRVLLADLLHHPDPRWRPQAANENFLGVYRWNILDEDR